MSHLSPSFFRAANVAVGVIGMLVMLGIGISLGRLIERHNRGER